MTEREAMRARGGWVWTTLPLTAVTIDDQFWAPRRQITRARTLPQQYRQLVETGRLDALRLTWRPGMEPVPHIFWDSDIAKWIEAASYSLATTPDADLERRVDEAIGLLGGAQQPDGYLNTYFTAVAPGKRWTDLRDAHELYCAGHLIEAGVAHFLTTGKRALLEIVCRYADHIASIFAPGRLQGYCGHEEIELALVKLARVAEREDYLQLAQYFVDERGRQPFFFEREAALRGTPGYFGSSVETIARRAAREYNQSHQPVRDQDRVVGHAVRAMYLYCAMADLAGEMGDQDLGRACRTLWDHLCATRLYITGGIGSSVHNEGFTSDYDLPNVTSYAETCAAIGLVLWAHRMTLLEGDARYADVLERALYNAVIAGVSLDGTRYFYDNPLESVGDRERQPWFGVACCPPNLARLLASLGQYLYAVGEAELAVHHFVQGEVRLVMQGEPIVVRQRTAYPWDGAVRLNVGVSRPLRFTLAVRLPGWCRTPAMAVNGEAVALAECARAGYARVDRLWCDGDLVELHFPMPVERLHAHPAVRAAAGQVALQRGPLIYCLEAFDNPAPLHAIRIPRDAPLTARMDADLLGGVMRITGIAAQEDLSAWRGMLYRPDAAARRPCGLSAVPYYAWGNRGLGAMRVWVQECG